MIHYYSLGRAARYFPEQTALVSHGTRSTFRKLHGRVARLAGALTRHGFKAGDRLAILLPNESDHIELVYACVWLGVVAVPLNTRLSAVEIDRVLEDANLHGLIRHSSLPRPTAQVSWQIVLDQQTLDVGNDPISHSYLRSGSGPGADLYERTTGRPKGVRVTHANILENLYHFNFWLPYFEHPVHLHAAPVFHIADFPIMFAPRG
jgi:acyl-CoA synthetase (AMP-forming)/AMP-acid ligase II